MENRTEAYDAKAERYLRDAVHHIGSELMTLGNACTQAATSAHGDIAWETLSRLLDRLRILHAAPAPSPDKEKGERKEPKERAQEKTTTTTTRAHTREEVGCSYVGPLREDVLRYAKRARIDADYAHWWYGQMSELGWTDPDDISKPIGNWKQLLRGWWRQRGKSGDDWKAAAKAVPRTYSRSEWALCAERCGLFDAGQCRCGGGCAMPPDLRQTPMPPEECAKYEAKGGVA